MDAISAAVKGLKEGTVSVEQVDKLSHKYKSPEVKKQEAAEARKLAEEEQWRNGRKGKGMGEDYDLYCLHCGLEFKAETEQCPQCDGSLIERKERIRIVKDKATTLPPTRNAIARDNET